MAYSIVDSFINDGLLNQRVVFEAPLSYKSDLGTISIVANITQKYDKKLHADSANSSKIAFPKDPKPIAYLQGGPGFPCAVPVSNSSFTKFLIDKGYQIIYYDQRGTGLSSPIEVASLIAVFNEGNQQLDSTQRLLDYILHFRADSIVEDMELVRKALLGNKKWLLLGQSYGGFCSFTYLSMYPGSLEAVMLTGGVPPIGFSADHVYKQTYQRTKERNVHYYKKYPQDVRRVKQILAYLAANKVTLPNGGVLSVERFQLLGIRFGATGGTDGLHLIVTELWWAIEKFGRPTYSILNTIQNDSSFDTNVIYALFQEAIYCDGNGASSVQQSNWAADRTRYLPGNEDFVFSENKISTEEPVFFTGEMVFKSMYEDYLELVPLKDLAYALHDNSLWSALYNTDVLLTITWEKVPVVAATYYYDQYVDFDTTMTVKKNVFQDNGNLKQYITSEFFHNGLRADPEKVLGSLHKLLDCEID